MVPDASDEEDKYLRRAREMAPESALSVAPPRASLPASCTGMTYMKSQSLCLRSLHTIFSSRDQV
jgi:hypothetical protein